MKTTIRLFTLLAFATWIMPLWGEEETPLNPIDITTTFEPHLSPIEVCIDGNHAYVVVFGGYAYVTDECSGLQLINIKPAGPAHIVKRLNMPEGVGGVTASDDYLYVANYGRGLRVIKLYNQKSGGCCRR